jgi:5'-nucleotidase
MPVSYELVVCISSTALFDCHESDNIWIEEGLEAYKKHQHDHVTEPLKPGVGFRLVESLLNLNKNTGKELVDVILVSRNDSEAGKRVRNSINHYNLGITRMSFTNGTDVTTYLQAWGCDLFLSTEEKQVRTVLSPNAPNAPNALKGIAAGLVCNIIAETTVLQSDDSL